MSRKVVYIISAICAISVVCILSFNFLTYEGDYQTISNLYNNAYADMLSGRSTSVDSVTKQIAQAQQQNGNVTGGQNGQNGSNNNANIPGGSDLGSQVVQEAMKYVGNPYVWSGSSLTQGCDCSHFVWLVYKNCGLDFGYHTSAGCRSLGRAIQEKDMKPGDIVCYSGHVAIYAGNGKIVEAQSSRAGITCNRNVHTNKAIITIRRVLNY